MDALPHLLGWLAGNGFSILAALAGIVVACVLWVRAPRSALLLLIASVMNLLLTAITAWYYAIYMPQQLQLHGMPMSDQMRITAAVSLALGLFHAIAYGLLIWAVADGRGRTKLPPDLPRR